jgi:Outer membrane protein beta-barrel domain
MNNMKKILLTTLTALLAFTTQAQFQLGVLTDYHYSYLYNKSDVAADARLDYVATFKPAFGAVLGYQISNRFAIQIAPQYYGAGQKFVGKPLVGPKSMDKHISLSYFQLPLQLNINLQRDNSKLRNTICIGGYVSNLVAYKETSNYYDIETSANSKIKQQSNTINNLIVTTTGVFQTNGQDSVAELKGQLTATKFNKIDIGLMLGYQLQYQINQNMSINLGANIKYGFSQIDNKDTIGAFLNSSPNNISKHTILQDRYCRDNNGAGAGGSLTPLRNPNSNNIFAGLQLSFIYTFGSKN